MVSSIAQNSSTQCAFLFEKQKGISICVYHRHERCVFASSLAFRYFFSSGFYYKIRSSHVADLCSRRLFIVSSPTNRSFGIDLFVPYLIYLDDFLLLHRSRIDGFRLMCNLVCFCRVLAALQVFLDLAWLLHLTCIIWAFIWTFPPSTASIPAVS